MSTKIYNGYKFDKCYSLPRLNEILAEWREKVKEESDKMIKQKVLLKFLYYYHYRELHGKEAVQSMIEKTQDSDMKDIWECVLAGDWKRLYYQVYWKILDKTREAKRKLTVLNISYDFRCEIQIIPCKRKLLIMYFGNPDLRNVLLQSGYLADYHYQDQTNRPDHISGQEWANRRKNWECAIGPDYMPTNHGFSATLLNTDCLMPNLQLDGIEMPPQAELIQELVETCPDLEDVEGYPKGSHSYSDMFDFLRTDAYKEWKRGKAEYVKNKCCFFEDIKDVEKLFKKDI